MKAPKDVLRDVKTTVPREGRTALLRIPLNSVNDGSTKSAALPEGILPPIGGAGGGGGNSNSNSSGGGNGSGGAAGPAARRASAQRSNGSGLFKVTTYDQLTTGATFTRFRTMGGPCLDGNSDPTIDFGVPPTGGGGKGSPFWVAAQRTMRVVKLQPAGASARDILMPPGLGARARLAVARDLQRQAPLSAPMFAQPEPSRTAPRTWNSRQLSVSPVAGPSGDSPPPSVPPSL